MRGSLFLPPRSQARSSRAGSTRLPPSQRRAWLRHRVLDPEVGAQPAATATTCAPCSLPVGGRTGAAERGVPGRQHGTQRLGLIWSETLGGTEREGKWSWTTEVSDRWWGWDKPSHKSQATPRARGGGEAKRTFACSIARARCCRELDRERSIHV